MAHELTQRENGIFEFAYRGEPAWHGLGQELEDGADIEIWKIQAGLDWTVDKSNVTYMDELDNTINFPDKRVLYRSDTKRPLSIVSAGFKIVQPGEVLEFFRDLVENHGMKLNAAGSLFGGTRFWATAELDKSAEIIPGDKVESQLLLTTSVDGTLASTAKFTSTRVVCQNTLNVALNDKSNNVIRRTHKMEWDPKSIKLDLGLISDSWDVFIKDITKLSTFKMSNNDVHTFFQNEFFDPKLSANDQTWGTTKRINDLMNLYHNGAGAEMTHGTGWGALNAVTNLFTHGNGRKRNMSNLFWDSYYGGAANIKNNTFNHLLNKAA